PKRARDDTEDEYDSAPPRKRSHSRSPRHASPQYRLAERPARRYSRDGDGDGDDGDGDGDGDGDDSADDRRYYARGSPSRSRSPSDLRSRSQSGTPPPRKPTALNYVPHLILRGHKRAISCVKFSPNGTWIASASADATIKIWSSATGALEHTLEGHLAGVNTLTWSPDSTTLASGSDDKSIRLWDAATGLAHPTPLIGHHNYVYSLAFSPKGNMLVSGSYDEAVFVWDVRAARVMRSLPAHSDPVSGVDFVLDGTLIASCSHDGLIRVWDTSTGQCLRTLVHEDNAPVTSVRFSPNGKYLLAHTLDSSIRLWDYTNGKGRCVKTYQGHANTTFSLAGAFGTYTAPDSAGCFAFVASASEDGEVVLWDVSSKLVLQRLTGHDDAVLAVDAHPRDPLLVSAGLDRCVRVWR
ncbi:WD40 repeat-like protein, partial [Lizonia empirigonia]